VYAFSVNRRRGVAVALFGAVALGGCEDGSYVIGRFQDESCDAYTGALACSGFEKPDLSDWTSVIVVNKAHVEETDARSHDGRGALHAESTGAKSAAVVAEQFPPVKDGELYLREYLYVPDGQPTKTINFLFLGDYATPDPFKGVDFNLEDGALSTYIPGNNPDRFTSTMLVIPRDRWFCLQIEMSVSPDAGAVTMRVDGEIGLEQKDVNTRPPAGIHLLRTGLDWSSEQAEPFEFYVDDLVLSTEPVDCE
jgi:hypothetical protein